MDLLTSSYVITANNGKFRIIKEVTLHAIKYQYTGQTTGINIVA